MVAEERFPESHSPSGIKSTQETLLSIVLPNLSQKGGIYGRVRDF
jgi:hypothetical protein